MKGLNRFRFLIGAAGALVAAALTAASASAADQSNAVVAVVNGYLISDYDLEQRVALNTILTGMPATEDTREKVLKSFEDEVIEMQEAARQRKTMVDRAEVEKALFALADTVHSTPDQIVAAMANAGVKPEVLGTQLTSQIVWCKLVMERYGNTAAMTDEQLSDAMDVYLSDLRRNAIIELK